MKTKMHILRTETIYDLLNDFYQKDIDSVALDFEMIKTKTKYSGMVFFDKKVIGFNESITNYYIRTHSQKNHFLFQKNTKLYYKKGLLNKKITYYDVPFND